MRLLYRRNRRYACKLAANEETSDEKGASRYYPKPMSSELPELAKRLQELHR